MEDVQEQAKLESAAKQIVKVVGSSVGSMLFIHDIIGYGRTQENRDQIYETLEGYGYEWKDGRWRLTTPAWINELVADNWIHHEITRD